MIYNVIKWVQHAISVAGSFSRVITALTTDIAQGKCKGAPVKKKKKRKLRRHIATIVCSLSLEKYQ